MNERERVNWSLWGASSGEKVGKIKAKESSALHKKERNNCVYQDTRLPPSTTTLQHYTL